VEKQLVIPSLPIIKLLTKEVVQGMQISNASNPFLWQLKLQGRIRNMQKSQRTKHGIVPIRHASHVNSIATYPVSGLNSFYRIPRNG